MIYLDNAATTKTHEDVVKEMLPYFTENYGNASSVYDLGSKSKLAITKSRETIAAALNAKPEEIYFTAGGSESDNWALKATAEAYKNKGKHIITSKIEHHAILHTCEYLEREGYEITYLDVDERGLVDVEELKQAIRPDTILISVMFANNEIGTIEPIEEIGSIAKEYGILFHTDAVQAFGQIPIDVEKMHIDMLSASGHKLNGPKGIGFLYIKEKTKIRPISFGGDQQKGMRSGTINVPGIAGLGVAAAEAYAHLAENAEHMYELKAYFADKLQQIGDVTINGKTGHDSAPQIISASFLGVRSEVLLHSLEDRCIYVSAGSACSSNHPSQSGTLLNIGLDHAHQESTLRFSFCPETTREELDYTYGVLEELLPMLRRYTRH